MPELDVNEILLHASALAGQAGEIGGEGLAMASEAGMQAASGAGGMLGSLTDAIKSTEIGQQAPSLASQVRKVPERDGILPYKEGA